MSEILYRFKEREYRLVWNWAKIPASFGTTFVANLSETPDKQILAFTRNPHHPFVLFDKNGECQGSFGAELGFRGQHGLQITSDGRIWCCDADRHVVYQLDMTGKVISTLGNKDHPCDNGYIREVPYPHNSYRVLRAGEPFNRPTGVFESPTGDVYCTDGYGNAALHRFDKNGNLISTWGGPGIAPGQFRLPHALWIDKNGLIWVSDRDNFRIEVFTQEGELVKCFDEVIPEETMFGPQGFWGDDEYLFVTQSSRGIMVFTYDLTYQGMIEAPYEDCIHGHGICGDSEGNLYIGHLSGLYPISKLERVK